LSNSNYCSYCQSHPCCCPDIQIENNPNNTSNPTNTNFNIPTPTSEPVQEHECSGFLFDSSPQEAPDDETTITANICLNNWNLEDSTVTVVTNIDVLSGQVTDVTCFENMLVATGTGSILGFPFDFSLTMVDTGGPLDVYSYIAAIHLGAITETVIVSNDALSGGFLVLGSWDTPIQGVTAITDLITQTRTGSRIFKNGQLSNNSDSEKE
jgi:hypothetical protein